MSSHPAPRLPMILVVTAASLVGAMTAALAAAPAPTAGATTHPAAVARGPASAALASTMTAVEAVELAWSRAWRPGDTDAEFHEKWVAFRELTKETFAPDVAEVRRRLDERAMDGYRRRIAEREAQREQDEQERPSRDA